MNRLWVCDDLPDTDYENWCPDHGNSFEVSSDGREPVVRHPIGFRVQRKPRIRVKAWTRPVLEG